MIADSKDAGEQLPTVFRGLRNTAGQFLLRLRGAERLLNSCYPPRADAPRWWSGVVARDDGLLMHVDTRRHLERHVLLRGIWEPAVTALLRAILSKGAVAFDVGANIGCHALTMAACVGEVGAVYAFEPNPHVRADLDRNQNLNRVSQLKIIGCALGETSGTGNLKIPAQEHQTSMNQGLSSLSALETPSESIAVDIITVDQYVAAAGLARLDLVKIDTQGYDAKVIRGMEESVLRFRPIVVFEFEDWAWKLSEEVLEPLVQWLAARRYGVFALGLRRGGAARLFSIRGSALAHQELVAVPNDRVGRLEGVQWS